ncbi:MAG TPA: Fn3-like domain-containing protein [Thermoanaerobaculia bacterium]|nr:Fn3-like domain-containing protein [Thermoanaerobaculia bacterium]
MKTILTFLAAALFATAAFAKNDGTVSLAPAVIMLRGEAGQSTQQTLYVENGTSRPLTFALEANDVIVRNGKRELVPAGSIASSIAATAVFSAKSVTVKPGERAAVNVTVTIPRDNAPRAIVALFRGTDRIMNGSVATSASLGALLTFALSDSIAMKTEPLFVQPQTATANLSVAQTCENSGTEPFVAKGMLAVMDASGRLAGKAALTPRRLLPGERVQLGASYSAELQPGRYRVLVTYDYEGRALTQSADVDVR